MIIFAHHGDCSLLTLTIQKQQRKNYVTATEPKVHSVHNAFVVTPFIKSLHPRKRSVTEDWPSHSDRGPSSHALWSAVNLTDLCHSLGLARAVLQQKSAIYYHPHHVQRVP